MRFAGWTSDNIKTDKTNKLKIVIKKKGNNYNYVSKICYALTSQKINYITEYKFLDDRKFRFDIAIPKYKIAIEFEGAIYNNGRHTRGKGYANDCKKYNLAVLNGWRLLRYTTDDTRIKNWEYKIVEDILCLIEKS